MDCPDVSRVFKGHVVARFFARKGQKIGQNFGARDRLQSNVATFFFSPSWRFSSSQAR